MKSTECTRVEILNAVAVLLNALLDEHALRFVAGVLGGESAATVPVEVEAIWHRYATLPDLNLKQAASRICRLARGRVEEETLEVFGEIPAWELSENAVELLNFFKPDVAPVVQGRLAFDSFYEAHCRQAGGWTVGINIKCDGDDCLWWDPTDGIRYELVGYTERLFRWYIHGEPATLEAWPLDPTKPLGPNVV